MPVEPNHWPFRDKFTWSLTKLRPFRAGEAKKQMDKVLKQLAAVKGKFLALCFGFKCCDLFRVPDRVSRSAEKEELAASLKREQDEVSTLKTQLAEITESHKDEMDHAASEKIRLEEEMQKLRDSADTAEKKADLAQEAARQFQARIDAWTAEFKKVQENMHGEFLF